MTVEGAADPITGKRKQVSRTRWPDGRPITSKTDAQRRGDALRQELAENFGQGPTNESVGAWLLRWLADEVQPNKKPNTYKSYRSIVENHLPAGFSSLKLRNVTPTHAAGLVKHWREKGLSQTRQASCWAVLCTAFNDAVGLRLIARTPFDEGVSHQNKPRRRPTVWRPELMRRFLDACRASDDTLGALFIVKAHTGARLGSLLQAQEDDYDRERKTLLLWDGKNDSSKRVVPLTHEAVEAIEATLARQRQETGKWKPGVAFREHWLFRSPRGHALTHSMAEHWFQALRERLNLPYSRPHDLRHNVASSALSAGVDVKLVSAMLGHSSSTVTREVYQHILDDNLVRQAIELVADQLRGGNVQVCPHCQGTGRIREQRRAQ
ncbi:MAG: tyrosine-type recombinase/integrase [Chloroflexota bacterium]|nr:tyrosine-type recombinase/integrase [Chloroflexota bacterium]